ncbi:protein of unknown function (plasmid) [Cupriavidus taiwanensis]|uniref:Uncharacterized protein n=1 Tax=Cupriavidus taiwanensis TaxID=164546 RepID=A0A375IKB1_9BURK|nr:protein of unknown function [Cupriavidus taiwanensis]
MPSPKRLTWLHMERKEGFLRLGDFFGGTRDTRTGCFQRKKIPTDF